jgi:hypothetical protein
VLNRVLVVVEGLRWRRGGIFSDEHLCAAITEQSSFPPALFESLPECFTVAHIRRETKILQISTALRAEVTSVVGLLHLHSGLSPLEYAKEAIDVQHPGILATSDIATNGAGRSSVLP